MALLIEPELSYKIIGICFEVHRKLGKNSKEKHYQRAVEILLEKEGINFSKEIKVDILFEQEKLGYYLLDFLIDGKIILELKAKPYFINQDYRQISDYLKSSNIQLGLLVNFGNDSMEYHRIVRPIK